MTIQSIPTVTYTIIEMLTSSDFNMLHLEAPQDLLQITDGTPAPEQAIELANPMV